MEKLSLFIYQHPLVTFGCFLLAGGVLVTLESIFVFFARKGK